jgi:ATP-binding cassette subfamily C (CFTR/MRP) protein 1
MTAKSGTRLHAITLKTVLSAPLAFFSTADTGSLTTRFSQDIQLLDIQLPLALMCVAMNLFICIAQAVLIASATFYIALSFPVLIAVFYGVQKYYLRTSRQLRFLDLEEKAPLHTHFLETLGGLATIRAFGWENKEIELNHQLVDRAQRPFYLLSMVQRWLTLVLDLITTALAVLVVGIAVKMREEISVGFTGVSLTQIISFTGYMRLFLMFWVQLETSIGAVARIKELASETANEYLTAGRDEPDETWPQDGAIHISNIEASYR